MNYKFVISYLIPFAVNNVPLTHDQIISEAYDLYINSNPPNSYIPRSSLKFILGNVHDDVIRNVLHYEVKIFEPILPL